MPPRSKIRTFPEDVRRELDARLIAGGFGGYAALAEWLRSRGFEIGASSVKRYGADLEQRIERIRLATEQAEALVEAAGETGALADASMRLIQEKMWDVLAASDEKDVKALSAAARALADTARASVAIRQERRKVLGEAAEAAGTEARRLGISPDFEAAIRRAVQGGA
ncbi:MAG: DUF3486 family protein [Acidobacteria bacterium]|nr:DUF3486 family protein [Acidobacteriota bacterium]